MELPVCVFKSLEYLNIYANYTTLKAEVMSSRWIEKLRVVKLKHNNQIIKETSANLNQSFEVTLFPLKHISLTSSW